MSVQIHYDHNEMKDEQFIKLRDSCLKAKDLAYAPYSNFRVGCTLITSNGKFISGANVENASYGAGICAERTAICKSLMEKERLIKIIAISSDSEEIISPCGICRQFIREFCPQVPVFMFNKDGSNFRKVYLKDLLPLSFGPENLNVHVSDVWKTDD